MCYLKIESVAKRAIKCLIYGSKRKILQKQLKSWVNLRFTYMRESQQQKRRYCNYVEKKSHKKLTCRQLCSNRFIF